MNKEIKFKAWHKSEKRFINLNGFDIVFWECKNTGEINQIYEQGNLKPYNPEDVELIQFAGLLDKNGKEYYIGDIAEFSNGDRFVLKMENYLEIYCDWIGEPECEDQTRDLYRIENAEIIGNIHQDTKLLRS